MHWKHLRRRSKNYCMPWTKKNRIAWMKCKTWIFLSPFSFACLETRIRRFETCMQIVVFCASQLVALFVINSVSLKLNTSLLNISAPLSVAQSQACVLVPSFPLSSELLDWYPLLMMCFCEVQPLFQTFLCTSCRRDLYNKSPSIFCCTIDLIYVCIHVYWKHFGIWGVREKKRGGVVIAVFTGNWNGNTWWMYW